MITGTTASGFAFAITDEALNDWELVEDLTRIDAGQPGTMVSAVRRLLGEDGYKALKEHCRTSSGRVGAAEMLRELEDIFANVKLKN